MYHTIQGCAATNWSDNGNYQVSFVHMMYACRRSTRLVQLKSSQVTQALLIRFPVPSSGVSLRKIRIPTSFIIAVIGQLSETCRTGLSLAGGACFDSVANINTRGRHPNPHILLVLPGDIHYHPSSPCWLLLFVVMCLGIVIRHTRITQMSLPSPFICCVSFYYSFVWYTPVERSLLVLCVRLRLGPTQH